TDPASCSIVGRSLATVFRRRCNNRRHLVARFEGPARRSRCFQDAVFERQKAGDSAAGLKLPGVSRRLAVLSDDSEGLCGGWRLVEGYAALWAVVPCPLGGPWPACGLRGGYRRCCILGGSSATCGCGSTGPLPQAGGTHMKRRRFGHSCRLKTR